MWRAFGRFRILIVLALFLVGSLASASEYHGQVFFNGTSVPGATVTVTQDSQNFATVTDQQGLYQFADLSDGAWKIRIEMRGFAVLEGDVLVSPTTPQGNWELKMLDLAQILANAESSTTIAAPQAQPPEGDATRKNASSSTLSATQAQQPADQSDEKQAEDALLINGSVNNASTSRFNLSPAFGNHRPGMKGLYNGGVGAIFNNSALNARPYSLTGLRLPKASYNQLTEVFTLGGPLNIPHLWYHGPNFFVAYERTRDRNAATQSGLVPDAAERSGDLSALLSPSGQPVTIINPVTGLPFAGLIPLSPQAEALLNLYPLPNLARNSRYNYQTQVLGNTYLDILQLRLDKTIGRRDAINGSFGFQSSRADAANLFNFRDTTDILGIESKINWSHLYHHQYLVVLGYHFTRLRTSVHPAFENLENISDNAGITGNDQSANNWGPPAVVFSSGISSLADAQSLFNRNRTDAFSLSVSHSHRRHTVTFGADFRKEQFNEFSQQNPRGVFTFTGAATSESSTTGADLADFLLGIPDTSAIAFGNPDKYFREPVYDAYVQDDWRMRPELSINTGLRWEYGAPLSELFGRLVNLDVAPNFSAVAPIVASSPAGPLTGTKYPDSLIRPDKRGFEPRIGIAWRPIPASTLVVRAGYGIYRDSSIYLTMAEMMAQQAPLSTNISVANSGACPLTLANGFPNCATNPVDTFGVDPNFRVGYAQIWQLSMQRDLPGAMVVIANYGGVKGTRGMQEFLPNTYPIGAANPCPTCPSGFVFVTSNGNSTRESGEIELRRRLRKGITAKLDYTYSKSIDDDSQIGAQSQATEGDQNQNGENLLAAASQPNAPAIIAQNWLNLNGERGLSSFDQRHLVKAQFQYTTGMGLGGGTLISGWKGRLLKEWTILSQISAGTGLPETPIFLATVPGTGTTGTIRPDVTGVPIHETANGRSLNPAAFASPVSGQWGTARRNSITGPNQVDINASLARTFRLRNKYNLDVRLDAINVLNHAVFTSWNTVANSVTFGLPASVNPMRSVQLTGRLRF
ncbi:MAG TPA: carboxypeptidase regulatory-like domain-containing protein [Terriglobales bacterium]